MGWLSSTSRRVSSGLTPSWYQRERAGDKRIQKKFRAVQRAAHATEQRIRSASEKYEANRNWSKQMICRTFNVNAGVRCDVCFQSMRSETPLRKGNENIKKEMQCN